MNPAIHVKTVHRSGIYRRQVRQRHVQAEKAMEARHEHCFRYRHDRTAVPTVSPVQSSVHKHSLHRLRQVRISEGFHGDNGETPTYRYTERSSSGGRIGRFVAERPLQVQEALGVPVTELLVEEGTKLSPPVLRRSQMLRIMKTARSILEQTKQIGIRRMAENLVAQMIEMMPELQEGGPGRRSERVGASRSSVRPPGGPFPVMVSGFGTIAWISSGLGCG